MLSSHTKKKEATEFSAEKLINPPKLLLKTLFNKVLEFKLKEKIFEKIGDYEHPYVHNAYDVNSIKEIETTLAQAKLLPQIFNIEDLHQQDIRNVLITLMAELKYSKDKATYLRLMRIFCFQPGQDVDIDFAPFEANKYATREELKAAFIPETEEIYKNIRHEISRFACNESFSRVIYKQLLFAANILTKDQIQGEMEPIVKWIIAATQNAMFRNGSDKTIPEAEREFVNKADLIRLILQVTHKQNRIATIDFKPFLVSGMLTTKEIEEIKAHPTIDNPKLQQLLKGIEYHSNGFVTIYQPLIKAGLIEKDNERLTAALCHAIRPYPKEKDTLSEKEKIEKQIKPLLNAMQQEAKLFQSIHEPLKDFFSKEDLEKARQQEVTTPNTFYYADATPMTEAAREGHLEIVKLLVENGADYTSVLRNPEEKHHRATPLVDAAGSGNLELVNFFLAGGADVNQVARMFGRTSLYVAASEGHTAMVELFLKQKGILIAQKHHAYNDFESTALCAAVRHGHLKIIHMLMGAAIAKIQESINKFYGLPMWLVMDIFSGLQDLQSVSFEEPSGPFLSEGVFLGPWLDQNKQFLMNKSVSLILDAAKTLPSVIDEKDKVTVKEKFQAIIKEQKAILLSEMEAAKKRLNAAHKEKAPEIKQEMDNNISQFINISLCLRRSLEKAISNHYGWGGDKPASYEAIKIVIEALMTSEPTRFLLNEMIGDLFKFAVQKNQPELIHLLIEKGKLLDARHFYTEAINKSAYFGRTELLSKLLKEFKEVDINKILAIATQGFITLQNHIDLAVKNTQEWDAFGDFEHVNKKAKISLHTGHLQEIGLNPELTDPEQAKKAILQNFKSTIETLLKSGLDVKLIEPSLLSKLAILFPNLIPDDGKLKLESTEKTVIISEEDSKKILEHFKPKIWKNEFRGFRIYTLDEIAKLKATLSELSNFAEHKADFADPNKIMIGLKLANEKSSLFFQVPHFVPKSCVADLFIESKRTTAYDKLKLNNLVDSVAKDGVKPRSMYSIAPSNTPRADLTSGSEPMDTKEDAAISGMGSTMAGSLFGSAASKRKESSKTDVSAHQESKDSPKPF